MKYLKQYMKEHPLNYVYYLVDKDEDGQKVMRVYCPNCGQTHTFPLAYGKKPVKFTKFVHDIPCECFKNSQKKVEFIHAAKDMNCAERTDFIGEFSNEEGEAVWTGYDVTTRTYKRLYDSTMKKTVLERKPVVRIEPVIRVKFLNDGTLDCRWSIRRVGGYYYQSVNIISSLEKAALHKKLKTSTLQLFNTPVWSMEELKGTHLERYIGIFKNKVALDESDILKLVYLHDRPSVRKLYDAGYTKLVDEIAEDGMYCYNTYSGKHYKHNTHNLLSLRSKSLAKILKVEPQKLDKACERGSVGVRVLEAAQLLQKNAIEITQYNTALAQSRSINVLLDMLLKYHINLVKTFKYMRRISDREGIPKCDFVSDYYDYLTNSIALGTPLTNDVVYPSKFKLAHDRVAITAEIVRYDIAKLNQFVERTACYKAVEYASSDYKISVITTVNNLIRESIQMHNCAKNYVNRICAGEAVLFVIRRMKAPDEPFAMLQLSPKDKTIIQNRGISNSAVSQEVQDFAQRWLTEKVLPFLAKQEKLKKAS